jgi:hypothetical protein
MVTFESRVSAKRSGVNMPSESSNRSGVNALESGCLASGSVRCTHGTTERRTEIDCLLSTRGRYD